MEHHMEVLLTAVVLIYSFGSSTGQDSYLDISTERKCANSQMILLSGDNFVIYFHYGYTSSVIDILQCLRGSETIFTFDQVDKEIITPNFIGRTNATFNETGLILSINAKTEGGNNDRATFSCSTDLTNAMTLAGSSSINSDPYEDVDESVVENQIKNLTFVIASLPADIIFYTETDPDDTLLDCQPATIISAIDVNGTVKCTGETQGTKCYCNFTMLEGSISTTENKICFNVSATLYSIDVHQLKCIPVDLATIMGEADDSITTEEPKVSSDGPSTILIVCITIGVVVFIAAACVIGYGIYKMPKTNSATTHSSHGTVSAGTGVCFTNATNNSGAETKFMLEVGKQYSKTTEMTSIREGNLYGKEVKSDVNKKTDVRDAVILPVTRSHITLTKSPDSAVDVKTEVTIKCQTYGVLTADNLLWTIVQSDKGTLNMPKIQQEGDMLILPVNETNRNKVVECYVSGNPQWRDEIKLDVTGIVVTQFPPGPVIRNTPVTFTCMATNLEPSHHLEWTVGGEVKYTDKVGNTMVKRSVFELMADKHFNGKEVQCYVKEIPGLQDTITLDVRDIVLTQYPPGPVYENTEATFTCEATVQASHKLVWTVGGTRKDATQEEMINKKRGKRSVFVLPITKELKAKTVECYVTDSSSKISVKESLDVKECGVRLIQYPPGPALEKTEVTFTCVTYNVELPANVIWKFGQIKGNNVTPTTSPLTLPSSEKGGALIFPASKSMNNSQVQCYVRNNPALTDTVTINVNNKKKEKSKRKNEDISSTQLST